MGIGGGIFLIAVGAILAYALKWDPGVIDLKVAGWVLILTGITTVILTVWYLMSRRKEPRRRNIDKSVLEQTRAAHGHAIVDPEPVATHMRPPPEP